jgi:predicted regulator of Ras-like GTPase activity (Roadblock/LC7/MglB family)
VTHATLTNRQLDWLVNDLVRRVPGVEQSLVVSDEGLTLAVSERVDEVRADQLAAVAAGLASLTRGAARCFDAEPVNQTIVEMATGYLFVTSAGAGTSLAVFADPESDIGVVGYELAQAAVRVAQLLNPRGRSATPAPTQ